MLVGALLIFALLFFFFGQSLVNAPEDIENATPTPTAFLRALGASTG